jgi:hypothetical protein
LIQFGVVEKLGIGLISRIKTRTAAKVEKNGGSNNKKLTNKTVSF